MIIDAMTQQDSDLDWFCVDDGGFIGHFASAGFKELPASVVQSKEDLDTLTNYFEALPLNGSYSVDQRLREEVSRIHDRYLRSYVEMANRGLFSFDIETYVDPSGSYFRVASPTVPLHVADLPSEVQQIVNRTRFQGSLAETARIPYAATLGM